MSAALFKQIRELSEAVAELRKRVAALEAKPSSRPVGRPPKVAQ